MKRGLTDYLVLVSGWSDNGWLSGGHAVRMALELCELCLWRSSHVLIVGYSSAQGLAKAFATHGKQ